MRRVLPGLVLLLTVLLPACAAQRSSVPSSPRIDDSVPVVFLPGTTGSRLRDTETGRLVWGGSARLFWPRDGGYEAALPIPEEARAAQSIEPDGLVRQIRVGPLAVDVYRSLLRRMVDAGYVEGQTLLTFDYDWRYGSIRAAQRLARELEALRLRRGEAVLTVDLVCQSNAARIARWYLKYGAASLEQAEAGDAAPAPRVRVRRLILVATAHGGALGTLRVLDRGRIYAPFGRWFRAETMFSFIGLFEALPHHRRDLFFDENGQPLDVDLLDPASWKRYGWSVYAPDARERLRRPEARKLFGDETQRERHLTRSLDRAGRFHALLMRDVPDFPDTEYYSIQSDDQPTPDRALLLATADGWRTRFDQDDAVHCSTPLRRLATAPGDGHATLQSQRWLSSQEQAALAHPPVTAEGRHRTLTAEPEVQDWVLRFLAR